MTRFCSAAASPSAFRCCASASTSASRPYLTGLFISDPLTVSYSAAFLRIMVVAMPMMSLCYPMIIQFQAVGNVKASLICSILRKGRARHSAAVPAGPSGPLCTAVWRCSPSWTRFR